MKIKSALLSVYHKEGLENILKLLNDQGVQFISTGGTKKYIEDQGYEVQAVEELTGYPSILDGRVKTLHPAVFGGILARRTDDHLDQLKDHNLPQIDLVIVDLYPFADTVASSDDDKKIIEKIDIGGISLIRAAAKNYESLLVVSSREQYAELENLLEENHGESTLEQRRNFARKAFYRSTQQDMSVIEYMDKFFPEPQEFRYKANPKQALRYGENPHQKSSYYGDLTEVFDQLHGKAVSFNNLVDIDATIKLILEFWDQEPTAVVIKHTNSCGAACRDNLLDAWTAALACDPVSAFGGIYAVNKKLDKATAESMDELFFEVVIAPDYDEDALEVLKRKKKRIILKLKSTDFAKYTFKSILNGVIVQEVDAIKEGVNDLSLATDGEVDQHYIDDMIFANICVKHLKSNAISLVKNKQLIGIGSGQTSRVDALRHAINKAKSFGFNLSGAVMASDAFFPFKDCVEIADKAGIKAAIQPGGSIRDKDSIDYCNSAGMQMMLTGNRHFKH